MDDKERQAIGLKKFSLISPVLNGQETSAGEYFRQLAAEPVQMPGVGEKHYSEKTFASWLSTYRRYGFDGLVKGPRADKGKSRKISGELGELIACSKQENPHMPVTVLYEKLISEGKIDPLRISRSTVYRYVEDLNMSGAFKADDTQEKESRRFAHEKVGEMCQADLLYGPAVKINGKKTPTYLHAFIDDCSRYPMWSQFYTEQNFESLRHCFKEAVYRRGVPRLVYTDNAKIYRSQMFEYICASLGCTLIHSRPAVPQGRGKVERFFRTVRMRFLSTLEVQSIDGLDHLNALYFRWLEDDYKRKAHSSLNGLSPHDVLMSQVSGLKMITDHRQLEEAFLYRISRKVQHDATIQISNILYETEPQFAGKRVEVRYDPDWIGNDKMRLSLFIDAKKIGEAWQVRFHDNAHAKRKFPGNRKKDAALPARQESGISYAGMMGGDSDD